MEHARATVSLPYQRTSNQKHSASTVPRSLVLVHHVPPIRPLGFCASSIRYAGRATISNVSHPFARGLYLAEASP